MLTSASWQVVDERQSISDCAHLRRRSRASQLQLKESPEGNLDVEDLVCVDKCVGLCAPAGQNALEFPCHLSIDLRADSDAIPATASLKREQGHGQHETSRKVATAADNGDAVPGQPGNLIGLLHHHSGDNHIHNQAHSCLEGHQMKEGIRKSSGDNAPVAQRDEEFCKFSILSEARTIEISVGDDEEYLTTIRCEKLEDVGDFAMFRGDFDVSQGGVSRLRLNLIPATAASKTCLYVFAVLVETRPSTARRAALPAPLSLDLLRVGLSALGLGSAVAASRRLPGKATSPSSRAPPAATAASSASTRGGGQERYPDESRRQGRSEPEDDEQPRHHHHGQQPHLHPGKNCNNNEAEPVLPEKVDESRERSAVLSAPRSYHELPCSGAGEGVKGEQEGLLTRNELQGKKNQDHGPEEAAGNCSLLLAPACPECGARPSINGGRLKKKKDINGYGGNPAGRGAKESNTRQGNYSCAGTADSTGYMDKGQQHQQVLLAGLLEDIKRHMDTRFYRLETMLDKIASRLDCIEQSAHGCSSRSLDKDHCDDEVA